MVIVATTEARRKMLGLPEHTTLVGAMAFLILFYSHHSGMIASTLVQQRRNLRSIRLKRNTTRNGPLALDLGLQAMKRVTNSGEFELISKLLCSCPFAYLSTTVKHPSGPSFNREIVVMGRKCAIVSTTAFPMV